MSVERLLPSSAVWKIQRCKFAEVFIRSRVIGAGRFLGSSVSTKISEFIADRDTGFPIPIISTAAHATQTRCPGAVAAITAILASCAWSKIFASIIKAVMILMVDFVNWLFQDHTM